MINIVLIFCIGLSAFDAFLNAFKSPGSVLTVRLLRDSFYATMLKGFFNRSSQRRSPREPHFSSRGPCSWLGFITCIFLLVSICDSSVLTGPVHLAGN
jgi:hypothetical protein